MALDEKTLLASLGARFVEMGLLSNDAFRDAIDRVNALPAVVWTNLDDGEESGLDADKLDGLSSRYFIDALRNETLARIAEDASLRARIEEVSAELNLSVEEPENLIADETAERIRQDGLLSDRIDREIRDRVAGDADLRQGLRDETDARIAEVKRLDDRIDQ